MASPLEKQLSAVQPASEQEREGMNNLERHPETVDKGVAAGIDCPLHERHKVKLSRVDLDLLLKLEGKVVLPYYEERIDLRGFDLSGIDLRGLGEDVKRFNFSRANLTRAAIDRKVFFFLSRSLDKEDIDDWPNLGEIDISNMDCGRYPVYDRALGAGLGLEFDLSGLRLCKIIAECVRWIGTNLYNSDISDGKFTRSIFRNAVLNGANASGGDFQGCVFEGEVSCNGTDVSGADFTGVRPKEGASREMSPEELAKLLKNAKGVEDAIIPNKNKVLAEIARLKERESKQTAKDDISKSHSSIWHVFGISANNVQGSLMGVPEPKSPIAGIGYKEQVPVSNKTKKIIAPTYTTYKSSGRQRS